MLSLKGRHIRLRALEPEDIDFLYQLENNEALWEISSTVTPYSKYILKKYIDNAHRDIYEVKQLRLCICDQNDMVMGFVDLFDYDPKNHRAGLGIVILNDRDRNMGVGTEAVRLMINYAFATLGLRQVYVNVISGNESSINLFVKLGFRQVGIKKDWIYSNGVYKDEIMYQNLKV